VALVPAAAWAQVSVEVTPLRAEIKMAGPGGTYTHTVTLANHDKSPIRIHATVEDYYLSKDGTPQFKPADGTMAYSAASWVRLNPVEQVLQPGASGIVRFTVTAPAGTVPGGYRGAIMFEFSPPGTEGVLSKGVMFKSRVVTIAYITVGAPKPAIELVDVQPREQAGKLPSVVVTLKNTGTVHVRTKGQMVIYDKAGTVVRRVLVPDVPVLPESEREINIRMGEEGQAPLPAGEYRIEVRIDIGLPELLVGETTVTIGS
jgi:lipoprotein-anchoring transpeptidase ErfK/SrfK